MITLKKLNCADIGYVIEALNEISVMKLTGSPLPITYEEAVRICNRPYQDSEWFVIKSDHLKRNVGLISLLRISFENKSADLSITIPNEQDRHQGYGTEAVYKVLYHAFSELCLHRIQLEVLSDNVNAEGLYQKVGFRFEGVRREAFYDGNSFKDFRLFSMLKDEWRVLYDKNV